MREKKKEFLFIRSEVRLPWKQSAGQYLTKFLVALRDNKIILGNRCPQCKRINLPPNIVCGWCKIRIEDLPENWVEINDKGTVVQFLEITDRDSDPLTGKLLGRKYPGAQIALDGSEGSTPLYHVLKETDMQKIFNGMRVQAVWKAKAERIGNLNDILYFKTIKD
ncbi:hypothetical protein ACFL9T_07145 [Thermodesulfobacteriota bacterium]